MVKINENIFRAYDIRGIYPKEINKDTAYLVGRAYIKFLSNKLSVKAAQLTILVSRDMRKSSVGLSKALIKGITDSGANVIDTGLSTSPMHYFGINFLKTDGGVMVTASHNPAQYNGLKISSRKATPISGDSGLQEIKKIILSGTIKNKKCRTSDVLHKNITDDYITFVTKNRKVNKKLKLVIDSGNGMGGLIAPKVIERLGIKSCKFMYLDLDGTFPNHEANPLNKKTLKDLQKKVLKTKSDLGIAFDGDGDRAGFVTHKGEIVRGDFITALIATDYLKKTPRGKIVCDAISSRVVPWFVEKNGGTLIRSRVGHTFMKKTIKKHKAVFGGEFSTHYYFKEFFNCDSGILAMIKVLEILSKNNKTMNALIKSFKKYHQSGEMNFQIKDKRKKMKEIENYFKSGKVSHLDGLTVEYKNWWFNLRPSNTEPLLRLNIEADTKKLFLEKQKLLEKMLSDN